MQSYHCLCFLWQADLIFKILAKQRLACQHEFSLHSRPVLPRVPFPSVSANMLRVMTYRLKDVDIRANYSHLGHIFKMYHKDKLLSKSQNQSIKPTNLSIIFQIACSWAQGTDKFHIINWLFLCYQVLHQIEQEQKSQWSSRESCHLCNSLELQRCPRIGLVSSVSLAVSEPLIHFYK